MITIITGTPGSGKTLYAVTKLLRKLLDPSASIWQDNKDGSRIEVKRRIFTNIKGLTLDHELIDGGGHWELVDKRKGEKPEWVFSGNSGGLRDWHVWAKPGDVIVFDEVQEVWKPRANGSPVPPDIGALETHRHMGVDFILITQGIVLSERNLSMLCGRHLHVRRVANMPFAIVYEWDSASRTLLYSKAMAKEKWWYDRSGYKLYKSAELHTKSPRRLPTVLFLLIFGIVAVAALGPTLYSRYGERFGWTKPITLPGVKKPAGGVPGALPAMSAASGPVAVASGAANVPKEPVFVGCAATPKRCTCFDSDMKQVVKDLAWCKVQTMQDRSAPLTLEALRIPEQERHDLVLAAGERGDVDLLEFVAAREKAHGASHALPAAIAPLPSKTPERSAGTVQQAAR